MGSFRKASIHPGSISSPLLVPRISSVLKIKPLYSTQPRNIANLLRINFPEYARLSYNILLSNIQAYLSTLTPNLIDSPINDSSQCDQEVSSISNLDPSSRASSSLPNHTSCTILDSGDQNTSNSLNHIVRDVYSKRNTLLSEEGKNSNDTVSTTDSAKQSEKNPDPKTVLNSGNHQDLHDSSKPLSSNRKRQRDIQSASNYGNAASIHSHSSVSSRKDRPTARYSDLGGIESVLQDVRELIERPLLHPEIYAWLGVEPPRGILLHGPPGCGKTQLAHAISGELDLPYFHISAPEVVSGMSGESEAKIRGLFLEAKQQAPSLIFIDEIDAITPKRDNASREMERRIVSQLLTSMDDLSGENPVMVIGATNRPDSLDSALRRAGRFDREICLGVPDQMARNRILKVVSTKLRLQGDFDFDWIAAHTPGYVGADLQAIAKEAASIAVNRIFSIIEMKEDHGGEVDPLNCEDGVKMSSLYGNSQDGAEHASNIDPNGLNESKEHMDTQLIDAGMDQIEPNCGDQNNPSHKVSTQGMDIDLCHLPVDALSDLGNAMATSILDHSSNLHFDGDCLATRDQVSNLLRANSSKFTPHQLANLYITMNDFVTAIKRVQPSSKREGFATVPNVVWDDIGALTSIRKELEFSVIEPIRSRNKYLALALTIPLGVLLYGPPGCGKTLLAKAVANQAQANFISVKGPELLNKFVGESERAVRVVFQRARASAPCIIFFDEIDALVPKRIGGENAVTERVVNQLLIEMDGLEERGDIFVVAATNRPDIIDPAMLRPGRLDKLLYVPLPTTEERFHILKTCSRKTPLCQELDLKKIAYDPRCNGFSGADLASLVREASMIALKEEIDQECDAKDSKKSKHDVESETSSLQVEERHFYQALDHIMPSVCIDDQRRYEAMNKNIFSTRSRLEVDK